MTLEETRRLGIEFERRVQTMIPETEFINKLDTETIYSYLNQYQDKFVHDIYKSLDGIPSPSKPSAYIETILQGLLKIRDLSINIGENKFSVNLPEDFGLYLSSVTEVSNAYSYKKENNASGYIPNTLVSQSSADQFISRPQDNMRIMRQPIAYLSDNRTIEVLYDNYTTPTGFKLSYYRAPEHMSLFTSTPCELPIDAFDDIVTGAVDLYVLYVAGAEARKRLMAKQLLKRNKSKEDEE